MTVSETRSAEDVLHDSLQEWNSDEFCELGWNRNAAARAIEDLRKAGFQITAALSDQASGWQDISTAPRGVKLSVARKGGQREDGSIYWYQGSGRFSLMDGIFHFSDGELYGAPELWHPYPKNPEHCALPAPPPSSPAGESQSG